MQEAPYKLPIVYQNLSPAETTMQILDSLEYFAWTITDAFDKLDAKIQEKSKGLKDISQRIQAVKAKSERVRKNKDKATSVYSLNKLPIKPWKDNHSAFILQDEKKLERKPYNLTKEARLTACENVNTVEVYDAVVQNYKGADLGQEREGLGKLPRWIDTLTSCLLFNTDENPYQKYDVTHDALEGKEGVDRKKEEQELQAAPVTLVDGEGLPFFVGTDFGFRPDLKDVPVFEMPANLPGLGGAANIQWSSDIALPTIAPSATMGNLPVFDVLGKATVPQAPAQPSQPPPAAPSAPPPAAPTTAAAPPPAAPAPPAAPTPAATAQKAPPKPKPAPSSGGASGGRGALLDAIRKGKKLKKGSKKKKKQKEKTPPPQDIMSALKARLAARANGRKGDDAPPKKKAKKRKQKPKPKEPESANDKLNSLLKNLRNNMNESDDDQSDNEDWSD